MLRSFLFFHFDFPACQASYKSGTRFKIFPLDLNSYPSLEGQVANISDDIAYLTHDFDDGLRENLFSINDLCEIKIIDEIVQNLKKEFVNIKDYE